MDALYLELKWGEYQSSIQLLIREYDNIFIIKGGDKLLGVSQELKLELELEVESD